VFLRRDGFFWFHPFAMTLAFAFQNLAAHVMKLKTKPLYLHVACSSSATACFALGFYVILDLSVPLAKYVSTWHGLLAVSTAVVSFAHTAFAMTYLWPGFLIKSLSRSTRVSVHRLLARLLMSLAAATILVGFSRVGLGPTTLTGFIGYALVLSLGIRTQLII